MPQTEEGFKIKVLIRTKITSSEHQLELINLAKERSIEYGIKKNWFFTQIIVDVKEKLQEGLYSDP